MALRLRLTTVLPLAPERWHCIYNGLIGPCIRDLREESVQIPAIYQYEDHSQPGRSRLVQWSKRADRNRYSVVPRVPPQDLEAALHRGRLDVARRVRCLHTQLVTADPEVTVRLR